MNDLEKNRLATLTRVEDFGAQHPTLFPAGQLAGQLMATIKAVADELNTHSTSQATSVSSARQGTVTKAVARAALREDLEAINRTARVMAFDIAGLDDKFRMPHGSDQSLLIMARAFVVDATPLRTEFVRYGLPEDFLTDLNNDIAAFEQATSVRNQSLEKQTASSAAIDEAMERGLKALKQLDRVMRNVLRDDIEMLTAWITASHVERVPHRRKQSPAAPEPQTAQ
ncbi:MAG TPA: hypothetical protein VLR90_20020 [Blastocatellia bacterium]|nr:hypothetical protein [Blastocatellia bacterium]